MVLDWTDKLRNEKHVFIISSSPLLSSLSEHVCIHISHLKTAQIQQIFDFVWSCPKEHVVSRGKGAYQIDYVPAPRITEADKNNNKRSLQRAFDRRLYLLIYGSAYGASSGKPVWHFPEKVYESEETLRTCAESALKSVIGDLCNTYFVGNAPMAHMVVQPAENASESASFKKFFFKSQVIAKNKFDVRKCEDFVWVTKDELLEYFPEQAEFFAKMVIS